MKVTAIFDIGKTNKKFFLFDKNFRCVFEKATTIVEIEDEDGFPCDDLSAIQSWITRNLRKVFKDKNFKIQAVNFSTYGASFVHLDRDGNRLTPLYNYLKPIPKKVLQTFYKKYGSEIALAQATASPPLGMLNSGLQLFWLKQTRPDVFKKIRWSLHLPQYLSFMLTGIPVSDFTSVGCHTALWHFENNDYHQWVYDENLEYILPLLVDTDTSINANVRGRKLKVGIGIHDSSAALLPYLSVEEKSFLLLSTGTWSIAMNPFSNNALTRADLENDCLNYMRINGKAVKAARLFLGNEHQIQLEKLFRVYNVKENAHLEIKFNEQIFQQLSKNKKSYFHFESIPQKRVHRLGVLKKITDFETAYHQLMLELVEVQVDAIYRAKGRMRIKKCFVDGGFAKNEIFVTMLSRSLKNIKIQPTENPVGSALGAAMVISKRMLPKDFFEK